MLSWWKSHPISYNRFFQIILPVNIFLNLFLWFFLIWKVSKTAEPIPLHYNIYLGIDWLGAWYQIFYLPLAGLLLFIVNITLAVLIYPRERLLPYFLLSIAMIGQILLCLAAFFIVSL